MYIILQSQRSADVSKLPGGKLGHRLLPNIHEDNWFTLPLIPIYCIMLGRREM